jgi:hypothetical protein
LLSAVLFVVLCVTIIRQRRFRATMMGEYLKLQALYEAAIEKMRGMRK